MTTAAEERAERARFLAEAKAEALRVLSASGPDTAVHEFLRALHRHPSLRAYRRWFALQHLEATHSSVTRDPGAARTFIEDFPWPACDLTEQPEQGPGGWFDEGVPPHPGVPR